MAVLLGLLQKVDGSTATAATAELGKPVDGKKHDAKRMKKESSSASVEAYAIQVIRAVANSKAATQEEVQAQINRIIGTIKDKNVLLSITYMEYADYRVPRYVIPMQLAKILIDQEDLYNFLSGKLDGCSHEPEIEDIALAKITDQKMLVKLLLDNSLYRLQDRVAKKLSNVDEKDLVSFVLGAEDAMYDSGTTKGGKILLEKIKSPANLLQIALFAKNGTLKVVAKEKISDPKVFTAEAEKLLKEYQDDEGRSLAVVAIIADEAVTVGMYDGARSQAVKQCIFKKLNPAGRAEIRARSKAACESKIAAAKGKGKETFELGGFYLGMDIAEVDALVGYYFPEGVNEECFGVDGFGDDDKNVRALRIQQQGILFCRANKDGKVFEFNFGKNFLKKLYKFDVQIIENGRRLMRSSQGLI